MNMRHLITIFAATAILNCGMAGSAVAIEHASTPQNDETRDSLVGEGTLIKISMLETISSAHCTVGDKFTFRVVDDVKAGSRVAIPAGTTANVYTIQAHYQGPGVNDSVDNSKDLTIGRATPTVTWANPAAITYGTPLSATQLDAATTVTGSFAYSPATGTVLSAGAGQALSTTFTPTDTTDYNNVSQTVSINVNPAPLTVGTGSNPDIIFSAG